jgi:TIR domain
MAYDVFISHSRKDKRVADAVCAALENAKIRCWIAPRDVQPGRSFAGEITRAIQNSKVLVLIFSGNSNNSEQVLREVQLAVKHRLHIVQFLIEHVVPSDDFAYFLSTPHWLDALTPPLEGHIQRLTAAIQTLLTAPAEPPARMPSRAALVSDGGTQPAPGSTDLAPLLAEYRRMLSAQLSTEKEAETPLRLWLNFPRAFVAGYGSVVEAKVENKGAAPLQQIELMLESNGFVESVQASCRQVASGNLAYFCVEVTLSKAGTFVMRCSVKAVQEDQAYAFRGAVPITVNVVPNNANLVVNVSDIQCVRGSDAKTDLGQEFGPVNIASLLPAGTIRTLNDLLNATFPQSFGRVPLELDYEVSQVEIAKSGAPRASTWSIPEKFLAQAEAGTKLKLEPIDSSATLPAIHLVARGEFKLGRSRQEADFLTWYWPRSPEQDDRTRRLSKLHVIAEVDGDKVILRDAGSANRATFEGHLLSEEENDFIDQRGTLILSHEYQLDVTPFASTLSGPLTIVNEGLWSGPPAKPAMSRRGCVRFMPVNSEIAMYIALWVFTDANFGSSKLNPLVLDIPAVAEVEGRFYYYRQNFWIEDLPNGNGVTVEDHALAVGEIVPVVNGARVRIGETTFRATVEP